MPLNRRNHAPQANNVGIDRRKLFLSEPSYFEKTGSNDEASTHDDDDDDDDFKFVSLRRPPQRASMYGVSINERADEDESYNSTNSRSEQRKMAPLPDSDKNDHNLVKDEDKCDNICVFKLDTNSNEFITVPANKRCSFVSQLSISEFEETLDDNLDEGELENDDILAMQPFRRQRSSNAKDRRASKAIFAFNFGNLIDDRSTEQDTNPDNGQIWPKTEAEYSSNVRETNLIEAMKDLEELSYFNIGERNGISKLSSQSKRRGSHLKIKEYTSFRSSVSLHENTDDNLKQCTGSIWTKIRSVFATMSSTAIKYDVEHVNENGENILHLCCRYSSPLDIVELILSASHKVARANSSNSNNLPLHIYCQHGANPEIIKRLIEAYPDGVSAVNEDGRTPLHLACQNKESPPSFEALHLLMVPLSNAMAAVEIINSVDVDGKDPITLEYLCQRVTSTSDLELMDNSSALSCLTAYLDAKLELCYMPSYTKAVNSIALLEESPSWFRETAAVHPYVRAILNWRITRAFSVGTLLMDGYINLMLIVCFRIASFESRTARFVAATAAQSCVEEDMCVIEDGYGDKGVGGVPISLLYIGVMYMSLRELLQATSMVYRGEFKHWLLDFWNWADCFSITLILISTTQMYYGSGDDDTFRLLTIITTGFLWVEALSILKTINHNFAVFISGLLHMALALRPFLCTMGLFLVAFAQMYLSNYQATDSCPIPTNTETSSLPAFSLQNNFCTLTNSYLKVYMMFVGNGVDESEFTNDYTSLMLSMTFSFVILILLLNILIAIVTDSYGEIAKKSENVFWCERMSFVFEVDQTYIFARMVTQKIKQTVLCFNNDINDDDEVARDHNRFGESSSSHVLSRNLSLLWDIAMIVFEDPTSVNTEKLEDDLKRRWRPIGSAGLLNYINPNKLLSGMIQSSLMRVGVAIFLPFWIFLGFLSAGILWPPQVKRWLLCPCIKEGSRSEQVTKMDMEDMSEEVRRSIGNIKDLINDDWNDVHSRIDKAYAGMERIEVEQKNMKKNICKIKDEVVEIRKEMCNMHDNIREIKNNIREIKNLLAMVCAQNCAEKKTEHIWE